MTTLVEHLHTEPVYPNPLPLENLHTRGGDQGHSYKQNSKLPAGLTHGFGLHAILYISVRKVGQAFEVWEFGKCGSHYVLSWVWSCPQRVAVGIAGREQVN